MKLGREAFSEKTLSTLYLIERKYREDYLRFLNESIKMFPAGTPLGKVADDLKKKIKKSITLIQNVTGKYGGRATRKDIESLYSLLEEIEIGIKEFATTSGASQEFSKSLEVIEKETNVSLEQIRSTQSAIRKTVSKLQSSSKRKSGAGESTLGSFARSLATGYLGVSGMQLLRGTGRLATAPIRGMKGLGEGRFGRNLLEELSITSYPSSGVEGRGRAEPAVAAGGINLFEFFDKQAYGAKWTADVTSTLHSIKAKLDIDKGKGGLFGGLAEALKGKGGVIGLLKEFGLGLGVAGAAAGVTALALKGLGSKGERVEKENLDIFNKQAEVDRLRAQQGFSPIERSASEQQKVLGGVAFGKLFQGEKLSSEEWKALWEQQKRYAGRAFSKTKGIVQSAVGAMTGIRFGESSSKTTQAEVDIEKSAQNILATRQATQEILNKQLGTSKTAQIDPYAKMDELTRQFMKQNEEGLRKLNATVEKAVRKTTVKDALPLVKGSQFENDTSHMWMNSSR
jgi:hypothetical protein